MIFMLFTTPVAAALLMGTAYAIDRWSPDPQMHARKRDLVEAATLVMAVGMVMSIVW